MRPPFRALLLAPALGVVPVTSVTAQDTTFAAAWRWAGFTTEAGLPANRVSLIREIGGIMWAATERGLAWYDGFVWRGVGPDRGVPAAGASELLGHADTVYAVIGRRLYRGDTTGFTALTPAEGPPVLHAVVLDDHRLLVQVLRERRLFVLDAGRLQPFTTPAPLANQALRDVFRTAHGTVWVNTEAGLFRWRENRWVAGPVLGGTEVTITGILERADGSFHAAFVLHPDPHRGVWSWERGGPARRDPAEGQHIAIAQAASPSGEMLVAYEVGELRVRRNGAWHAVTRLPTLFLDVLDLTYRNNGDLWVATRNGVYLFQASLGRWRTHRYAFPDRRNRTNDLLVARDGRLWVATAEGLHVHERDGALRTLRVLDGSALGEVTGLAEDTRGRIWAVSGSAFGGAWALENGRWRRVAAAEGLTDARIHRIATDRSGNLWFLELAGRDTLGVVRYDGVRFTRWADHPLFHDGVYAFAEATDGSYWFGTRGGLLRWRTGTWTVWTEGAGLRGENAFALAAAPDGAVWFADRSDGIARVGPTDSITYFDQDDGLLDNTVMDLRYDDRGVLWIATYSGLSAYDRGRWLRFDLRTGLVNPYLWPVLPARDSVYVGSIGGMAVLSRAEAGDPAPRVMISPPVVQHRDAIVRWMPFAFEGRVAPEQIQTRYRVDGGDWSPWSRDRQVLLTSLGAGRHAVEVQAKGLFGQVDEMPARADFRIPLPFVLRPPFALPVGGLLLALAAGGVVALNRRRRDEAALRRSERQLRTLLEHAPEAIVMFHAASGRFVDANRNAVQLFGMSRETLLSLGPIDVSPPAQPDGRPSAEAAREVIEAALRGETPVFEWVHRAADGRDIPCEVRLVRLPGDRPLVRGSITDVSQRRTLEHQLRHAQKMEAVGELTGGIAHDFNNILTAVLAHAEMVRHDLPPGHPQLEADLKEIQDMARRGAGLVHKLMAFSRSEPLELKPIDLGLVIEDMTPMLRRVLPETIRIEVQNSDEPTWIRGERGALEQIVLNLATNARDAMRGGGVLRIETAPITLKPREVPPLRAGPYARLIVRDDGVGMDQETASRVFEPFFTTKRPGHGTGLGLAMVYGLVERHGGHVSVRSTPGAGTAMTILLPMAPEGRRTPPGVDAAADVPGGAERVLVVEDEPAIRRAAGRLLTQKGYRVDLAEDGVEALAKLTNGAEIQLVFTDVVMPRMGGWELYQAVRAAGNTTARFVFTSGYTAREGIAPDIDRSLPFLQKPWVAGDLLQLIRDVLDGRR